ncbi:MAG: hypothetical protein AABW89_06085 [Nanoarchaeota archaeon]
MFNQRKGVSEVVANVLIVLLVIVGIAVLWSVVKPTIDKGAAGIRSDCFTVSVEPVSCVVSSSGTVGDYDIVVKRNPGAGEFENVDLLFEDSDGATERYTPSGENMVSSSGSEGLRELETTTIVAKGITIVPEEVNIVITSGGQLCQITTQPISCE